MRLCSIRIRTIARVLVAATVVLGVADAARAGQYQRQFTLSKPTFDGEQIGRSVAVAGNTVVAGAPFNGEVASEAGMVYLADATTGTLIRTLLKPGAAATDHFGWSVAADGTSVLVGAPLDDTGATDAGAAYLFDLTTGALLRTFTNPSPISGSHFGWAVGLTGDTVVISAPMQIVGGLSGAGAAYVFSASTGQLVATLSKQPTGSTPAIGDQFGYSVSVSGTSIFVGAPFDDAGAGDAGAVYRFDTAGSFVRAFQNPTPQPSDNFGFSVAAVSGNLLAGAPGDNTGAGHAGSAYLIDASSGATLLSIPNPQPAANDEFGYTVAAAGSNLAITALFDDTAALDSGTVYLIDGSTGAVLQTIPDGGGAQGSGHASDNFGFALAASATRLYAGIPGADVRHVNGGIVLGFALDTGQWQVNVPSDIQGTLDNFGRSVAVVGNTAVIGVQGEFDSVNIGGAYLYDLGSGTLLRKFSNPTPNFDDYFGRAVAAVGTHKVLIDADGDDAAGTDAGAVYLFDTDNGALLLTLLDPNPQSFNVYGQALAAVGDNPVVADSGYDTGTPFVTGIVYLFDGTTGAVIRTFVDPSGETNAGFAHAVAAHGNDILISATTGLVSGKLAGKVYVFDTTTGQLKFTLSNPTPADYDEFGAALGFAGNDIVVGAPQDDKGKTDSGVVHLFDGTTGQFIRTIANPHANTDDSFGSAVGGNATTIFAGTPNDTSGGAVGAVYVFDKSTGTLIQSILPPQPPAASDHGSFGWSLSTSGTTFVVGEPFAYPANFGYGLAYIYKFVAICGDGVIDPPETCDDANTVTTDCCVQCQVQGDGSPCSDNNLCTQTDQCQAGQCVGSNPVVCQPSDQCHYAGTCNPGTGNCSSGSAKTNGTLCHDGNACTLDPDTTNNTCFPFGATCDHCQSGNCVGGDCQTGSPCTKPPCGPSGTCQFVNNACSCQ